jgi:hypothetical protein
MHAAGPLTVEAVCSVAYNKEASSIEPPVAAPRRGCESQAYGSKGVLRTVFTRLSTFCPAGLPIVATDVKGEMHGAKPPPLTPFAQWTFVHQDRKERT